MRDEDSFMSVYREFAKPDEGFFCTYEKEFCDDGEIRYFVDWDISDTIDEVAKQQLKDTLQIDEDNYFTMDTEDSFCTSDEEEANEFFSDLIKIINDQLERWSTDER